MPEQRLERTRATLPAGYQFGDRVVTVPVGHVHQFDVNGGGGTYVCACGDSVDVRELRRLEHTGRACFNPVRMAFMVWPPQAVDEDVD